MKNFKVGNNVNVNGTSLKGYIDISYHDLVTTLGEPTDLDGDKTLAEWSIEGHDGTVATIYDWKNYGGKKEQIVNWHIGGNNNKSVELIRSIFPTVKVRSDR